MTQDNTTSGSSKIDWQAEVARATQLHDISYEALRVTSHFSVSLEHTIIKALDEAALKDFSQFISGEVSTVFNVGNCVGRVEGLLHFLRSLLLVANAQAEQSPAISVFDVIRALSTIIPLELAKLRLAAGEAPDEIKEVLNQLAQEKTVDKSKLN